MKIEKLEQRVEILAQKIENGTGGGGAPADAYTKAQADAKFQTIAGMSAYQTTAGMSSYLTTTSAAETYQPKGSYLTESDISDMATQTWVGSQGFLTSADIDEVPPITSSDGGKFLRANYYNATGTSDYTWENIPTPSVDEVPDVESTDDGKVLTATYSGGTGSYAWATPASGGLSVETDGTNYWITVNGIRLYFASTAPTGTIPTGSIGIGW